mmetsp:Transcript_31623/g.87267  ORF Transcript_31623/g.87267 Transcript_31623/m.87267 type:complete len:152 (-) Transcript_31623:123-578(-)
MAGDDVEMCGGGSEEDGEPDAQDLGIDTENFLASAATGVPLHERLRIAQECVVGQPRLSNMERALLLQRMARTDRRLLRDRLSHLAEGTYDIDGDVVRLAADVLGNNNNGAATASQVFPDVAMERDFTGALFRKRGEASAVKAHTRRAPDE